MSKPLRSRGSKDADDPPLEHGYHRSVVTRRSSARSSRVFATWLAFLALLVTVLVSPTSFARPTLGQITQTHADLPRLRAQAGARSLRASDRDDAAKLGFTQQRSTEGEHAAEHEGVGEVDAAKRRRVGAPLSSLATQTYAYNALGALHQNDQTILDDQRPKLAGGGNASSAVPYTFNSTPVTLDGGGRITLLDGVNLKYSRRGALIGATKVVGPTTQGEWYGHDPDGRRIARVVSSTTANVTTFPDEEYFAWTGGNVVARLEKTGAVRQGFLFEGIDKPLRLRDTASNLKYYYELDIAGNVRRLRRTDGSDAGGYRYSGFGVQYPADQQTPVAAVDQPLRWKGRWWSDFAKIYDVRARQWSPDLGSFTSIDEFRSHDPLGTLWGWPGMSPILWRDPWGRDYEDTGAEGWFLRNSDALMVGVGVVTVSAVTLGTADFVFAALGGGYGAAALALGAAGATGTYTVEAINSLRTGQAPTACRLADSVAEGAFAGFAIGSVVDIAVAGIRVAPSAPPVRARLPQDASVSPNRPRALSLDRPISSSVTQNQRLQADIVAAKAAGAYDIRVNQQQINADGVRVGVNRPDLQYTNASGRRVYVEYDTPESGRGPGHEARLLANDPLAIVKLVIAP